MKAILSVLALVAAMGFAGTGSAMEPMMPEGMKVDPMATECMTMASKEADMAKMEAMVADCKAKYPDAAAIECTTMASMEKDTTKMDAMMAECKTMYPDAMGAVTGGAMAPAM